MHNVLLNANNQCYIDCFTVHTLNVMILSTQVIPTIVLIKHNTLPTIIALQNHMRPSMIDGNYKQVNKNHPSSHRIKTYSHDQQWKQLDTAYFCQLRLIHLSPFSSWLKLKHACAKWALNRIKILFNPMYDYHDYAVHFTIHKP